MRESLFSLADDLSGALEIGASLRGRGWKVTIPLTDAAAVGRGAENQILVLSSETRASEPASAEEQIRTLLLRQRANGRRLWFKKVDSTMRGQIAAEIKALYSVLKPPFLVLCPANPDTRRTVRDGQLLVEGRPLHETAFKDDPRQPIVTSDVAGRLGDLSMKCARLPLGTLRQSAVAMDFLVEAQRQGRWLIVSDAETNADLRQLVCLARRLDPTVIFVGSNGLARALVGELGEPKSRSPDLTWPACAGFLAACGSRHPASQRQLDHFSKNGGRVLELDSTSDPIVQAGGARLQRATALRFSESLVAAPARCLEALTKLTVALARRFPDATLYLTGGETAAAVCTALHLEKLEIVGEFQSGVVRALGFARADSATVKLIIKPGGYGPPDLLTRLVRSEFLE